MTAMMEQAPQVAERRTALIRGLRQLAEWVDAHPELPVPIVEARIPPSFRQSWEAECAAVDAVAAALNVTPQDERGHYRAEAYFGPVEVSSTAITAERMARHYALTSYHGSVIPDATDGGKQP